MPLNKMIVDYCKTDNIVRCIFVKCNNFETDGKLTFMFYKPSSIVIILRDSVT